MFHEIAALPWHFSLSGGIWPESALARADFLIMKTELGKISWWWQGAWPLVTFELAGDRCGKGRLSFLYSGDERRRPTWIR